MGSIILPLGISTILVGGPFTFIVSRISDGTTEGTSLTVESLLLAAGGLILTLIGGVYWLISYFFPTLTSN